MSYIYLPFYLSCCGVDADLHSFPTRRSSDLDATGKKTVEAIQQEIAGEVSRLLSMILQERRKNVRLDLEAVEMALRSAMHQVSAVALGQLLQCDPPGPEQRQRACSCGQTATYQELRSRRILTVVGEVELLRPYYLCPRCHHGQFPLDV